MRSAMASILCLVASIPARAADPAQTIADRIDRAMAAAWTARGISPAAPVDDLTFLRRSSIDLIGRIPTLSEIDEYRASPSATRRTKLLDRLLKSSEHADHLASLIRVEWMPKSLTDFRLQFRGAQFESWLAERLMKKTPFDRIIRDILTANVNVGQRGEIDFDDGRDEAKLALTAFYQSADARPEEMAAATSRLFLGVKLECAQCHDHPFAPYTKEQFWEFAAFFGEFTPLSPVAPSFVGPLTPQYDRNRITIPNTEREVEARYFNGGEPTWSPKRKPREELADWLTRPDNPFFDRNIANRLWAFAFGIGLVDPVDEPSDNNPPSHPELLTELATIVRESKYDLALVLKGIALSSTYQRSHRLTHPTQSDPRSFARFPSKAMTGHQIFDSLLVASGKRNEQQKNESTANRRNATNEMNGGSRGEFVSRFPQSNRSTQSATSILQSLMLMNGKYTAQITKLDQNPTLQDLQKNRKSTSVQKVERLFLAVLTRMPTDDERERFASYLDRGGPGGDEVAALEDLFWILINSSEFLLNH